MLHHCPQLYFFSAFGALGLMRTILCALQFSLILLRAWILVRNIRGLLFPFCPLQTWYVCFLSPVLSFW